MLPLYPSPGFPMTYAGARALPAFRDAPATCDSKHVTLMTADHYPISAMRYDPIARPRANLIVAGATGVPQGYYRRFASFAAANGFSTLTLDYRGIGLSAPPSLKHFKLHYFDWARLDLAAAVDAMASPQVPLYMIGHSYGGHAFGLLPNHHKVAKLYTFGTGTGWIGWMSPLERIKVLAMWHLLGPLLTAWKGYLPLSLLGMGEDLPLSFYRQWKHWCRFPNNFLGDPSLQHVARSFARVRTPILAANATDDPWCPPRSRDAFMAGYTHAEYESRDIDPRREGLSRIGHMGYFRASAMTLWLSALRWLEAGQAAPPAAPPTSLPA